MLIQEPSFDAESCKPWREIRKGLLDALADPEERIWVSSSPVFRKKERERRTDREGMRERERERER